MTDLHRNAGQFQKEKVKVKKEEGDSDGEQSPKKKKREKKYPNAPKKPKTAYLLFCDDERVKVRLRPCLRLTYTCYIQVHRTSGMLVRLMRRKQVSYASFYTWIWIQCKRALHTHGW